LLKQPIRAHAETSPGRYKAVVSFQVLEHVRDPAGFIGGCVKALAPGGAMILAVPDHDGVCGIAQNNILDMPPHHVSHWNEQSLTRVATQFQLELIRIEREPTAAYHVRWAQRSLYEQRARALFGLRPTLLDTSLLGRVTGRLCAWAADVAPPSIDTVSGHTILACYRKS
jgi:SAM-dependent methyltransferase